METPRLLTEHDQRLSDRAVDAASHSGVEERTAAHHAVDRIADLGDRLDRVCVFSAWLMLYTESGKLYAPVDSDVRHWANELAEVQHNHEAATAARKAEAIDAVG